MKLKWGVFLYFVIAGLVNGYLFCTLWNAQPKETHPPAGSATGDKAQKEKNPATADKGTTPAGDVTCTDTPDGTPTITTIEPDLVAIGDNNSNVAIYGCNFKAEAAAAKTDTTDKPDQTANASPTAGVSTPPKPGAPVKTPSQAPPPPAATDRKVYFNGVEREAKFDGDHKFVAQLLASDFASAQTITIAVAAVDTSGKAIVSKTSVPSSLKVKSASDVMVAWHLVRPIGDVDFTTSTRLIVIVLFAGAFGACITGLKSFVDYAGDCKLRSSWYPFYFAGPFLGAGVALAFYVVLRGGMLAGTTVDEKAVNPYGMVAMAVLVGMFSDAAIRKLNDVFDTLFKPPHDTRSGTLLDLGICPDVLPEGTVGVPYKQVTFQASGGTAPYTWSQVGLPDGLSLSDGGVLGGKPTAPFNGTVKVLATDSANPKNTGSRGIPLTIKANIVISPDNLPDGTVGADYAQQTFQASGGTAPYTWSADTLPDGLSLSKDGGVLKGKPTKDFAKPVKIQVTDSAGNTGSLQIPLTIKPA